MQDKIETIKLVFLAISSMFLGVFFGMRTPGFYEYEIGRNLTYVFELVFLFCSPLILIFIYLKYKIEMSNTVRINRRTKDDDY